MKTPRKAENPWSVMITIRLGKSETSEPIKNDKPGYPGPMKNDIEEMSLRKSQKILGH